MSPDGNNMFIDVPLGNSLGTGVGGIGGTNWSRPGFGRSAVKFEIAELLVYDSVLPDSTRRGVEKYLGDKYQLSPSLRDGK